MVGGFPIGGASIGSLGLSLRIIAIPASFSWEVVDAGLRAGTTPPRYTWEGIDANSRHIVTTVTPSFEFLGGDAIIDATAITTPSMFDFVGVDSEIRGITIADPSVFNFLVNDARYKIVTIPPTYTWKTLDALLNQLAIANPSLFEFKADDGIITATLITVPPNYRWVGEDANSFAEGAVEVTSFPAVFEWVGQDAIPSYNVSVRDIPNLVVNRSGKFITLDVLNQQGSPVFLYKAPETKSGFSLLANTSTFPFTEEIDPETSPKYKASFGILGSIGGETIKIQGVKSTTRYSRREDE